MAKKHNSLLLYVLSALIPCTLLLVSFALQGLLPFGDRTVMMFDASSQYVDFVGYLQRIFAGEENLLYSFSKNLGGEMVSLFGYYLFSPFSILFAFGTAETIPYVFTLVIVLKICACGVTFFYGLTKRFGSCWENLIFSTAYAMMAYTVVYGWNIMWMDGVIILPLLALGLEQLWQKGSPRLYIASLAYALMTNFYIGYMLCAGSVLFSLALMAVGGKSIRETAGRFGKFVLASCIGGFAAAFSWLPTFFTLIGGRGAATTSVFVWSTTFNVLGLAGKLVAGSADISQIALGLPNVFCGLFTILLVMLFFLNGKVGVKNRMVALGVMAVLLVSFLIRGLDVIWHGFSPNNAFNFRYSFIFSYVLLMIARYAWERRGEVAKGGIALCCGMILVMCAGLLVMKRFMGLAYLSQAGIGISAAVTVVAALYLMLDKAPRKVASVVLCFACLFELGANYYICVQSALRDVPIIHLSEYQQYIRQTQSAVDAVRSRDSGFYRMEKTFRRSQNDALLLGYNGLSHFSSSQDKAVPWFMKDLGMNNMEGIWAEYAQGSTASFDTLMGVRYVLSRTDLASLRCYDRVETVAEIDIYENEAALPIAMAADPAVTQLDLTGADCFQRQSAMLAAISGSEIQTLLPENNWVMELDNLTVMEDGITYVKEDPEAPAALTYTLEIRQAMPLYCYFYAPQQQNVQLTINGEPAGAYFSQYRWDAVYVGTFSPGEKVQIALLPADQMLLTEKPAFCYEDLEALASVSGKIRENAVQLNPKNDASLTGTVTAREDGMLLLTIPYDEGWKLSIDGEPVRYTQVMGLFLAAQISRGEHTFQLRYEPRGALVGCVISAVAVAAALVWWFIDKKKKQMP